MVFIFYTFTQIFIWYRVIRVLPRWQISLWHFRCLRMGQIDVITYKYVINTCITFHFFALNINLLLLLTFLSLAVFRFILNKLPFKWYKVPTMLLEKVSMHTEILFVHREHIYDNFQKISAKNILHLYDISNWRKRKT
jgi:hypothetical protein